MEIILLHVVQRRPGTDCLLPFLRAEDMLGMTPILYEQKLQEAIETCLNTQATIFYEQRIGKLANRNDKCYILHGVYV